MIGVNGYLGFHQNVLDPSNPCSSTVIGKTRLLVVIRWPVLTLDHSHTVMLLRVQLPYTTVCLFTSVSQTSPLARGSGQSFYWSVMPSGGAGTFLQWLACTHVALSATFTAVCVISRTWNGPFHLLDFQCFLLKSLITTKSPGLISCKTPSAGLGRASLTC